MKAVFSKYFTIPKVIIHLMMVDVALHLINSAFTVLLNFEMGEHGFKDFQIASMVGNRYLTVLLCSVPLALLVKGKKLKPFIMAGSISAPIVALVLLWAIHIHNTELIRMLMALWGIAFSLVQILVLPYILLNGSKEHETESITLFFGAANITLIVTGIFNFILPLIHQFFTNEVLLVMYSLAGFIGVYFVRKLPAQENTGSKLPVTNLHNDYDWGLIIQAAVPTFIIAFGAGFTIPFINLFFHDVHGMESGPFSLMSSAAFGLVAFSGFFAPELKKRFGYGIAITAVQSVAILLLFILGTTEWYKDYPIAIFVAVTTYVARQPLMNMAGPLTSELTLNYVGERNREMISALNAAIWSGCWFASAKIFSILREANVAYANIIFITLIMYIIGVAWYSMLIRKHERKLKAMVDTTN